MARPRKKIDAELVEKLALIQCTMEEIASVVGCSVDTLERRFADTIKKGRDSGKTSLKRQQYKLAMDGNPTMLVWLGKQHLGQADKRQDELTGKDGKPLIPPVDYSRLSDAELDALETIIEKAVSTTD